MIHGSPVANQERVIYMNLYVHNRTGKLWNMIRHVKSHTNSSVTHISMPFIEEYYKKKISDTNAKGSYIQECTSAAMSKYSKIENLVMDKMYYTDERLTRFIKSLKSGCTRRSWWNLVWTFKVRSWVTWFCTPYKYHCNCMSALWCCTRAL